MPVDKEEVIKKVKKLVSHGVYEDEDFEITDKSVSIDLSYDGKGSVRIYQNSFMEKFPGAVSLDNNKITIHFNKIKEGALDDSGSKQKSGAWRTT